MIGITALIPTLLVDLKKAIKKLILLDSYINL